jgi:Tfp pilus assembly protein PilN
MLAPEQVAAVNRAVAALNLPWDNLFGAVEAARPEKVALLNLEPDGVRRSLRLVAEARDSADMLAFVDRLAARPELATVNLVKHEIQEKDAQRPLRFQVDAQWKEAP